MIVFRLTFQILILAFAHLLVVGGLMAVTQKSADYSLSGGTIKLGGSPARSDAYTNVGFIRGATQSPQSSSTPTGGPIATSGSDTTILKVLSTGFRLVPNLIARQRAVDLPTGIGQSIPYANGTQAFLPAVATSLLGGVVQFSSGETVADGNSRPVIEWHELNPFDGMPADEFEFKAWYADGDGNAPDYVKLHLDDSEYEMKAMGKSANFADGVVFAVKVNGLSWGPHEFSFSASDGTVVVKTFWEEGPFVEGGDPDFNHSPELWDNLVDPDYATPDTEFTFQVVYEDEDGDEPEFVQVVVDGVPHDMAIEAKGKKSNPLKGILYGVNVGTLPWGPHDHYFVASDGKDVVKTRQVHGPFVEGDDPNWNDPPELSEEGVDPLIGTPVDEYVFQVFYQDEEGDEPEYVRVELDGTVQEMELRKGTKNSDYRKGAFFEWKAKGLPWGPHRHRFVTSDGTSVVSTRLQANPFIEGDDPNWNEPPELFDADLNPRDGTPVDEFVFQVIYQDEDGDIPEYVRLELDGKAYDMESSGKGNALNGLGYRAVIKDLAWGPHEHRFVASDGQNVTVTYLEQSPLVQGDNPDWDEPPELFDEDLEPWEGTPVDEFVFRVVYYDEEGTAPEFVKLVLDGKDHSMKQVGGKSAEDGLEFEVSVTGLDWGPHHHQFAASDGTSVVTTWVQEDPFVQGDDPGWNSAPELWEEGPEPWEGLPGDSFEFSVYYYDEENDAPDSVKLILDSKEYAMSPDDSNDFDEGEGVRYTVTLNEDLNWGPHVHRFVATSGEHFVSTPLQQGPIIGADYLDLNDAPELEVIEVDPYDGTPETKFTFWVSYWDDEGDSPDRVELLVDGKSYPMKLEEGDDFADEVLYMAVVSGLDWGPHAYKAIAEVDGEIFETSSEQGPYVEGEPDGWNLVPELEPMEVDPWDGTPEDEYAFSVYYWDEDGDAPEYVRLVLDGKDYTMAPVGRAGNFEDGVEYAVDVSGLQWGPHSHFFVASDGEDVVSTRPEEGPMLEGDDPNWDEPPELDEVEVDPDPGLPSDEFTFRITYYDAEGRAPEFVKLVLDGNDYSMKVEGKAARFNQGVSYTVSVEGLTWGPHTSYFVASDGVNVTTTEPEPMPFVEGDDPDWNEPPLLEEENIEPWEGTPSDEFTFRIVYSDEENEAPEYVRLLLDGQAIEMTLAGKAGKYYQGVAYQVALTGLAWGPHRYQFVASDGQTEVMTWLEQGPMVEGEDPDWNYAPELWDGMVEPEEGPQDGTYTYSVYYQDEEGDVPEYVRLKRGKKTYSMNATGKKKRYALGVLFSVEVKAPGTGPHAYIFEASDGENETQTYLQEGPWIEGEEHEDLDDYPPELDRERLKPDYGPPDSTFVFSVRYRDIDGTPPKSINVEVDGKAYSMSPAPAKKATTLVKGVVYEASVSGLGWGPHRHRFVSSDGAYSVATPMAQGPFVGGDDPNWNTSPELEDYAVEPEDGSPSDEYFFSVTYLDEDNDPPSQIFLFLDGKKYALKPADSKNREYFRGVEYTTTVKGLDWGPHAYLFTASDGNSPVSTGPVQGPWVLGEDPDWNQPPELDNYEVSPWDGTSADTFEFHVTYMDEEGIKPKSIELVLDGKTHGMTKVNAKADDYVNGVEYITTLKDLQWGPHAFRFTASDGTTDVWTPLEAGPYVMGSSPDWNEPPEIWDSDIEPYEGTPDDEFTFRVLYHDEEGDAPEFVKLRLDGKNHSMAKEDPKADDYVDGVWYMVKVSELDWGPHRHSFLISDETNTSTTTVEVGPYVQGDLPGWNNAPELFGEDFEPWDGTPADEYVFRVEYWDPEGDAPRFVNLFLDGTQHVMQLENPKAKPDRGDYEEGVAYVVTVSGLQWGPHQHYFTCSDGKNAVRTQLVGGPYLYGDDPDFNQAPEVADYDVEPGDGPPTTTFEFFMEYFDAEGSAPEFVRLYLDGKSYEMQLSPDEEDPDYEDGVGFVYQISGLSWGPHSHYFEISDGTNTVYSTPIAGPYVQGEDSDWNRPPDLEDGEVAPWESAPDEPLRFRVFYSDEDGDAPSFVHAFLDGEQIELTPVQAATNHRKRMAYVATVQKTLAWGPHRFWFSASDGENVVVTQPEQGPILLGENPNWNPAPYLEAEEVTPWDGTPDEDFNFTVSYEDEGNQPPSYVKLHIDDQTIDMVSMDPKAKLFAKGVDYVASINGLVWGPHKYRFSSSDGTHEVFTPWQQGPFIQGDNPEWNQPPDIENWQVKPEEGNPETEFVFKVSYLDENNDAPEYVRLLLDGESYDMNQIKESDRFYKGVSYRVAVTGLQWGPHQYAFTASDGNHVATTLPEQGPYLMGEDANRNFQPEITDWKVEPDEGGPETEFVFTAEYEDSDGDAPAHVRLILDGNAHDMTLAEEKPDYLKGALFSVAIKGLAWGPHRYRFVVSDGQLSDETRPESGPYVQGYDAGRNRAPELSLPEFDPPVGSPEDTFIFRVLYSDAEGDLAEYVNLAIGDYFFPMSVDPDPKGKAFGTTYVVSLAGLPPGNHSFAFEASDGRNLGETRWIKGPKITGQKPKVVTRLAHQRIPVGGTLNFSIEATGTHPMAYLWLRNGEPIAGATDSTLTLTDVHLDDIGLYRVEVTNIVGTGRSNAAKVLVVEPPNVVENPETMAVESGESIELSVVSIGTPSLSYQWFHNGQAIHKGVKSLLKFKAKPAVEGTYTVQVTNDAGSVVSEPAQVIVFHKPILAESPQSISVIAGEVATFSAKAVGKDTDGTDVNFQWFVGKLAINDATADTLTIDAVDSEDVGVYSVRVSNQAGVTTTRPVRLKVLYPPEIVAHPMDIVTRNGGKAQFVIKATGTKILKYQWFRDDQPVKGAIRNRLKINPVKEQDAGDYWVEVTNDFGTAGSRIVSLSLSSKSTGDGSESDWRTPFAEWTVLENLAGKEAALDADGDDDGVANLLEYAFAGNPYQSDPYILPEANSLTDTEGKRYLALTWRESMEATDVAYNVQVSPDLREWAELDLSPYAVSKVDAGDRTDVTVYLPMSLARQLFLRVAVTSAE